MHSGAFSTKQRCAMLWWRMKPYRDYEAIICDGAVRSGKTLSMGIGFFLWAMSRFENRRFGLCGRTKNALRRNVLEEVLPQLRALGMRFCYKPSEGKLSARFQGRQNVFYIFGGKDEASAALIQGITFAGVLLDEVVLMPRSFVEQALARCSVEGSKIWFNCNPEGPQHWFYRQWVLQAEKKRCLHLHFTMDDNPSLSEQMKRRYERLYAGTFYRRFVLGLWVAAEGRVYDFFDPSKAKPAPEGPFSQWYISCDYGTVNPASFGLWGKCGEIWYRVREFYFDSKKEGRQMTDTEYAAELRKLAGGREIRAVIVDPSAASFILLLRQQEWNVKKADNAVLSGIRKTADALREGKIVICSECVDCLRETELYCWEENAAQDRVKKQNDHAMDDMRYFVTGVLTKQAPVMVKAVLR